MKLSLIKHLLVLAASLSNCIQYETRSIFDPESLNGLILVTALIYSPNPTPTASCTSLRFTQFGIEDSNWISLATTGNDNGIPNRNETIRMDIEIFNPSSVTCTLVRGRLSTTSSLLSIDLSNNDKLYGTIESNRYRTLWSSSNSSSPTTNVYSSHGNSYRIFIGASSGSASLTLTLTDGSGSVSTTFFSVFIP